MKILFSFYILYILGLLCILYDIKIPNWYISIIIFFTFKWLFNYRKCTLSYFECLLRNVKKEDGILYNILEQSVDIRNTPHVICYYLLSIIILFHFFITKKYKLNI